jgi:hypothetical protein
VEDEFPLKLGIRDALERTHQQTAGRMLRGGGMDNSWGVSNGTRLCQNFHKRKFPRDLEHIQQGIDNELEKVAKECGLPQDLMFTFNSREKQNCRETNSTTAG